MTTKSLDQLRNAFKTPDRDSNGSGLPNNYYPFWNMKEGESAIVRFLPDGNSENPLGFLVEKIMHNLDINGERKSVPCLSMYGEDCPICALSSQYYKAEDKTNGKKYWKKKQHIAQAVIVEDPLDADDTGETHEGKVRYVALGYQVFNIIKAAFEDGELDEIPYAYDGGTNFIIKKSKQGEYASYSLSKFARKSTDLDEDVIANFDLADLADLLPKNPGIEKVEAMLEAAVTGAEYNASNSSSTTPVSAAQETPAAETSTVTESNDDDTDDEADDILAQIRARRAAKAE